MTPLPLAIVMILLTIAAAGFGGYWAVALLKIRENLQVLPTARDGLALAAGKPPGGRLCVVVPAHNEAEMIASLIASLRAQDYPDLRVVLALDRCTDNTKDVALEAIAGDGRFEIVIVDECPPDWAGKVNAAWSGVDRSDGARDARYLLFTDADCWFEPGAVTASVALLEDRGLDLLSLFSTLTADSWFERVVQPAASLELARWYPLLRANETDEQRRRPFANGQFMLFDARAYREIGGHNAEEIRGALLEDIGFARLIHTSGRQPGLLMADGMVRCAMYDTWDAFRRGWKRIYTESANRKHSRLRVMARRQRLLALLPVAALAAIPTSFFVPWEDLRLALPARVIPPAALLVWLWALVAVHRGTKAPLWAVLVNPVATWMVAGILAGAAGDLRTGRPTSWGGRQYDRAPR